MTSDYTKELQLYFVHSLRNASFREGQKGVARGKEAKRRVPWGVARELTRVRASIAPCHDQR